jgi:hypothetical protein
LHNCTIVQLWIILRLLLRPTVTTFPKVDCGLTQAVFCVVGEMVAEAAGGKSEKAAGGFVLIVSKSKARIAGEKRFSEPNPYPNPALQNTRLKA